MGFDQDGVTNAVLDYLNGGHLLNMLKKTIIVLIPNVKHPKNITQYKHISLCNVIYKLCSKILASRLRKILDEIIVEEKSALYRGDLSRIM